MSNRKTRYKRWKNNPERDLEVDLGLAVMCALQYPGQKIRHEVIADITGMTREGSMHIEHRALLKLRRALGEKLYHELKLYVTHQPGH